jgi:hypothetical protein
MPSLLEFSAEELVIKGIAPVKREFILPFIARKQVEAVAGSATAAETGTVSTKKKSKGQIKRVRSHQCCRSCAFSAAVCAAGATAAAAAAAVVAASSRMMVHACPCVAWMSLCLTVQPG